MNRKFRNSLLITAVAGMSLAGLNGSIVREEPAPVVVSPAPPPPGGDVVVQDAPPPDQVEVIPPAPDPTFVWVGGFWGWGGGRYYWHRGYWNRPPYGHRVWVRDHWNRGPRGYVMVRGHWG
jgi:hypothetical protein